jgi:hypothetical protein
LRISPLTTTDGVGVGVGEGDTAVLTAGIGEFGAIVEMVAASVFSAGSRAGTSFDCVDGTEDVGPALAATCNSSLVGVQFLNKSADIVVASADVV